MTLNKLCQIIYIKLYILNLKLQVKISKYHFLLTIFLINNEQQLKFLGTSSQGDLNICCQGQDDLDVLFYTQSFFIITINIML